MRTGFISLILIISSFFSLILGGCSNATSEAVNETSIIVDKKGLISHEIVESFNKSYYDEDELEALINQEISDYCNNVNDEKAAKLDEFIVKNGTALARIKFASAKDYASFNDVDFFFGTVDELMLNGYSTDVTLKNIEDSTTISKYEFEALKDNLLIAVSEPVRVVTPKKIEFVTANIDVVDDNIAYMSSESSGLGYIVLK